MKGFKRVGSGQSAGFKFPASMGFTGSTGRVTNVSPHVRRKGFASGGFVRQDNRMKCDVVGDQGSALVRRARPSTAEDQDSGGKTPLRPGYGKGGRAVKRAFGGGVMSRGMRDAVERAKQQQISAPSQQPSAMAGAMTGGLKGALSQLAMRARQQTQPSPNVRTPEIGRKMRGRVHTYAEGGAVAKGHGPIKAAPKKQPQAGSIKGKLYRADGGKVKAEYPKPSYMEAVKDRVKEIFTSQAKSSTGMAKRAADKIEARRSRIDAAVDEAVNGKNYARGGKARMTKC
jgi:hypothetical protein